MASATAASSSSTAAAAAATNPVPSLLSWLQRETQSLGSGEPKFFVHPSVEVAYAAASGYGLRLKSALTVTDKSELLAEMPRSMMLHPNTTKSEIAKLLPKADGWTCMVLLLMHEMSLGAASYWYEWLKCLPAYGALGVPFVWENAELHELDGSSIMDKVDFSELEIDYRMKVLPFLTANAKLPADGGARGVFPTYARRVAASAARRKEYETRKAERAAAAKSDSKSGDSSAAAAAAPASKNAAKNRKKKLNKAAAKAGATGAAPTTAEAAELKALADADAADEANDMCSIRGYKTIVSWVMTRAFAAHTTDGKDYDLLLRANSKDAKDAKDTKTDSKSAAAAPQSAAARAGTATAANSGGSTTANDNIWMCPVLDFVNSDARTDAFNAYIAWTPNSIQLRSMPAAAAGSVLPAGTELLINYADSVQSDARFHTGSHLLSNSELLRRYGFVLESYDPTLKARRPPPPQKKSLNKGGAKQKTKAGAVAAAAAAAAAVPRVNKYAANDTVEIPVIMVAALCKNAVDEQLAEARRAAKAAEDKKRKRAKNSKGGKQSAKNSKQKDEDDAEEDDGDAGGDDDDADDSAANEYGVGGLDYEYFVIGRDGRIPDVMRQLTQRYARMLDPSYEPPKTAAEREAVASAAPVPFDAKYDDDLELLFLVFAQRLSDYGTTLEQDRTLLEQLIAEDEDAAAVAAGGFDAKALLDTEPPKSPAELAAAALTRTRFRHALVVRIAEKEILEAVIEQLKAQIKAIDDAEGGGEYEDGDGDEDDELDRAINELDDDDDDDGGDDE